MNNLDILARGVARALVNGHIRPHEPFNGAQLAALKAYKDFLGQPDRSDADKMRAYVDMATGTGKTGVFSTILRHCHLVAEEQGRDDYRSVIVVPTIQLQGQTRDELISIAPELEGRVGLYGGGNKILDQPVTIMTYNSWVNLVSDRRLKADEIGLHITDEAHRGLSDNRQFIVNDLLKDTIHFGVTATAAYDEDKTMERTHRNLLYRIGLREAVEAGYLANSVHVQFALQRLTPEPGMGSSELIALKRSEWSRLITRAYAEESDDNGERLYNKTGVIFAANTEHADFTATMLNDNPILQEIARQRGLDGVAIPIHSVRWEDGEKRNQSRIENKDRFGAFMDGRYLLAIGDDMFKEGFDHKPVKFVASFPGNSLVDIVQKIGRAARKWHNDGVVIFEAVPYIGSDDPELDQKAKTKAQKDCITALEVLGGSYVLGPEAQPKKKREPSVYGASLFPREPIVLSPHSTAELYLTEEDTLKITREIDNARSSDLIDVTEEMRAKLNKDLYDRGMRVIAFTHRIADYERENGLESSDITKGLIETILRGGTKNVSAKSWTLMQDVIRATPLSEPVNKINITEEMRVKFKNDLDDRGMGARAFANQIADYERENGLEFSGVTKGLIERILTVAKNVSEKNWFLMQDVIHATPLLVEIEITEQMRVELRKDLKDRGMGARAFANHISQYERETGLEASGISEGMISGVLNNTNTVLSKNWILIQNVIFATPLLVPLLLGPTAITEEMRAKFDKDLDDRGMGARAFANQIAQYEQENGLKFSGIKFNLIDSIRNGHTKNVPGGSWLLIQDVLHATPMAVKNTQQVRVKLRNDLANRNMSVRAFAKRIVQYQQEKELNSLDIGESMIAQIFSGATQKIMGRTYGLIQDVILSTPVIGLEDTLKPQPKAKQNLGFGLE